MSRYYRLDIGGGRYVFTNQLSNGRLDPGALKVELDLMIAPYGAPGGQSTVTIWGVPLVPIVGVPGIAQVSDLNGLPVIVSGGMQAGLPFATADAGQAGVLVSGQIFAAYGNWLGTNMSITLVITPDGGATQDDPANISFSWKKGTPLAPAIKQTLSTAYPNLPPPVINISPNLVLGGDEAHFCWTLQQFSGFILSLSRSIIQTTTYAGVVISRNKGAINVSDGTVATPAATIKQINFVDLIGQPTWLGAYQIAFSTVLRGDISIGDVVQLPLLSALQSTTSPTSFSQFRNRSAFQGAWQIGTGDGFIRHVGDSRGPDAQSWVSVFSAFSIQAPQSVTGPGASAA